MTTPPLWPEWSFRRLTALSIELGEVRPSTEDPEQPLAILLRMCRLHVSGADGATIMRQSGEQVRTMMATDDDSRAADLVQVRLNSGPALDALGRSVVQRSARLDVDERWPTFGKYVTESFGWRSIMSIALPAQPDGRPLALTAYSRAQDAFSDDDVDALRALGAQCATMAVAAASAAQVEQLRAALSSNRDIGAAIGILMAHRLLKREEAFDLLRSASRSRHRKLIEIATEVLDTGTLELAPQPRNGAAGNATADDPVGGGHRSAG